MKIAPKYAVAALLIISTIAPTSSAQAAQPASLTAFNAALNKISSALDNIIPPSLADALVASDVWAKAAKTPQASAAALSAAKAVAKKASATANIRVGDLKANASAFQAWSTKLIAKFAATYGNKEYKDIQGTQYGATELTADTKLTTCAGLTGAVAGVKLPSTACDMLVQYLSNALPATPPKATNKEYILDARSAGQAIISDAHTIYSLDNGGNMPAKATPKQIATELATAKADYSGPEVVAILPSGVAVTVGGQVVVTPW